MYTYKGSCSKLAFIIKMLFPTLSLLTKYKLFRCYVLTNTTYVYVNLNRSTYSAFNISYKTVKLNAIINLEICA